MSEEPASSGGRYWCCACGILAVYGAIAGVAATRELEGARRRGNESAAIGTLKGLRASQEMFREADKEGDGTLDYGTLAELSNAGLIDGVLGSGQKQGYRYELRVAPSGQTWIAAASPSIPPGSTERPPPGAEWVGASGEVWYVMSQASDVRQSWDGPFELGDDCVVPARAGPLEGRADSWMGLLLAGGPVVLVLAHIVARVFARRRTS